ncbi:MAG: hypothetical protein HY868_13380 [Chloroflexi bacterium]|nr:hypothetical protein [Chloroflexota bacterium]
MNRIALLAQLHTLDHEHDEATARVRAIAAALAGDPLAATRAERDATHKKLGELAAALRDRDLEAQTLDAKIREVEQRLYSGRVTIPKELDSIEKDLQMHRRQRGALDETRLELMDAVEQAQTRADETARAFAQAEQTRANEVERLTRERDTLNARIIVVSTSREHTRASLDADALRQYDQLRRAKAGRAVAQLVRDACGMCGVTVPTGLASRVRSGSELVLCPSCGRILAM